MTKKIDKKEAPAKAAAKKVVAKKAPTKAAEKKIVVLHDATGKAVRAAVEELANETLQKATPAPEPSATIILTRSEFQETLAVCRDFAEKKNTMPILGHILLSTQQAGCLIQVTDLDKTFTRSIAWKGDPISTCIPVDILYNEVKALSSDITEVELKFDKISVQVNGRCRLFTLPADHFPKLPELVESDQVEIPGLVEKLSQVIPAVGESDTRYTLNGACINFAAGHLVGTDGHRMHLVEFGKGGKGGRQIIVPKKAAQLIVKHKALNTLLLHKDHVTVIMAGGTMLARLIDGTYPNYDVIIPKANPVKIKFHGAELLKILEGALPLSKGTNAIRMIVNGQIEITTQNPDLGDYRWFIACESEGKSEDITLGFNAQYLIDAIRSYTTKENDSVTMEINQPLTPCLLNKFAVVMPMKV